MKLRKILKSMFNNYCKTFKTYRRAICSDNKTCSGRFLCPDDGGCDYRWRCEVATITAFKMLSGVYDVPAAECRSELVSDVVACQLVIKQILDVLDVIAPVEVREKCPVSWRISTLLTIPPPQTRSPCGQSKSHRAYWTQVYPTGWIPLKTAASNRWGSGFSNLHRRNALAPMMINAAGVTRHSEHVGRSAQGTYPQVSHCALHQEWFAATDHHAAVLFQIAQEIDGWIIIQFFRFIG